MKLSDLTLLQKEHLAWRLDHNTSCGLLTACRIARGDLGDADIVELFVNYGKSIRSAKILAGKVARFKI